MVYRITERRDKKLEICNRKRRKGIGELKMFGNIWKEKYLGVCFGLKWS